MANITTPHGEIIVADPNFGTGPVANTGNVITLPNGAVLAVDANYPPPWID